MLRVALPLAPVLIACVAGQAATAADSRVDLVEHSLAGKYYVAGTVRPAYSISERMKFYRVPGVSIAVVDQYRIVWARAYGVRDSASNAPAQTGTRFQAASMSKPVAAAAILRLFEERGLSLDADVNTMLRSWRVPPPPGNTPERVTLRRLLSHSAGINVSGFAGYDRDAPLPTLVQVLDGAPPANSERITVTSVPGSAPSYSGGGTTLAQQVASTSRVSRFRLSCSICFCRHLKCVTARSNSRCRSRCGRAPPMVITVMGNRFTVAGTSIRRWRRPVCGPPRRT
jgi:CubicO group peptidase (beta-lactamase class C family)